MKMREKKIFATFGNPPKKSRFSKFLRAVWTVWAEKYIKINLENTSNKPRYHQGTIPEQFWTHLKKSVKSTSGPQVGGYLETFKLRRSTFPGHKREIGGYSDVLWCLKSLSLAWILPEIPGPDAMLISAEKTNPSRRRVEMLPSAVPTRRKNGECFAPKGECFAPTDLNIRVSALSGAKHSY